MENQNKKERRCSMFYTTEEAEKKIKRLMDGPEQYSVERDATEVVLVTREELIENVRRCIRP